MDDQDAADLAALEESLWRPATRFDPVHLESVLADDFDEFGASGRLWTRDAALAMEAAPFGTELPLPDLRVRPLGEGAALLTYRSVTRWPDGARRSANRSSVWTRVDGRWRLRFHQGTPAEG